MNRYSYALNNPVKYTDPSGHYVETAIDVAFLAMDINDIRTGNADKWTYIGLATDVVCALAPGVTGGRLGVQALEETVTHGDELAGFFNRMDKVVDTEKKVDNAIDAGQAVNHVGDAFGALDWDSVVSRAGETRRDHVMLHSKDTLNKDFHGVFNDNPLDVTDEAWKNRRNIAPITEGNVDIYYIPYENAGFEGGRMGSHETLNYVKIVTKTNTNQIISSYPSKLME